MKIRVEKRETIRFLRRTKFNFRPRGKQEVNLSSFSSLEGCTVEKWENYRQDTRRIEIEEVRFIGVEGDQEDTTRKLREW